MLIVRGNPTNVRLHPPAIALAGEVSALRLQSSGRSDDYAFVAGPPPVSALGVPEAYSYTHIDTVEGMAYKWDTETKTSVAHPEVDYQVNLEDNTISIAMPHFLIRYAGKFDARWLYEVDGEQFNETKTYTVYQPLFTKEEIVAFDGDFAALSPAEIERLERVIREVIESITGQKFHLRYGAVTAKVHGGRSMMLSERLVALANGSKFIDGVLVDIKSDGWIVSARQPTRSVTHIQSGVLYDPYTYPAFRGFEYNIVGEFGYASVPETIKLAAMLLAQDYGCKESVWRERYIENMKNANWGVTYNEKAFVGTGNVSVDRILQGYTLSRMAVV